MYIPTGRLDAFYSTRLSPTIQASISAITDPHAAHPSYVRDGATGAGNLLLSLQHDTGRWCTDYTWDSDGGVWGLRVLRNFGKLGVASSTEVPDDSALTTGGKTGLKRIDEEEAMEGGLKGRISAGAEFYVSAERSAGGSSRTLSYSFSAEGVHGS